MNWIGKRTWLPVVAVVAWACVAGPAVAARLHVLPGGERVAGPSQPGDWSMTNCYGTLDAAATAASPADTLLLSRHDHPLTTLVTLTALLADREFGAEPDSSRVVIGAGGGLVVAAGATSTVLRGIGIVADSTASADPAVRVFAPGQSGSTLRVQDCTFDGLRGAVGPSAGGAALHIVGGSERIAVEVIASTFSDCRAGGPGGAIYAANGVDLTIRTSTFTANEAYFDGLTVFGGALAVFAGEAGSSLTLLDCVFLDNVSWGPAGAIYAQDTPLVMRDTEVRGSRSAFGGVTNWGAGAGVFLRRAGDDPQPIALIAERCSFVDNRADLTLGVGGADGGGMMIRGSDSLSPVVATIVECHFERNFSDQGAGLYVGRSASATIERSVFLENIAHTNGGGAYKGGELTGNIGETALFSYCLFVRNRAGWDQNDQPIAFGGFGGAFMVRLNPRAEFHNCTFADNLSGINGKRGDAIFLWNEGQAISDDGQRSRIVNCVFYGDTGNAEQVRSEWQALTEIVNSAWESGQVVAITTPMPGRVIFDGSPFLGTDDYRLRPASECIDAGASVVSYDFDLVGTPVPLGDAPEIGAYEHITPVSAPVSASTTRLHAVHPNPANPRAVISFELARRGRAEIAVFDAAGRHVADLLDLELQAGEHRLTWNGNDTRGRAVASGVYFVHLRAAGTISTAKLTLVR